MVTIITRSALVFHGHAVPDDLAYVVVDDPLHGGRRIVTWAEVMENRREHQRRILARRRNVDGDRRRAVKLLVAYFDQDLFGGWHAFIEDYRGRDWSTWIDRDAKLSIGTLMRLYPLVPPVFSVVEQERDQWHNWKVAFARRFQRRTQHGRPLGVDYLWRRPDGVLERGVRAIEMQKAREA